MTNDVQQVTAHAEWLRDRIEARRLADELGCDVTLHPDKAGILEARNPVPGIYSLIGTPDEIRAEIGQYRRQ